MLMVEEWYDITTVKMDPSNESCRCERQNEGKVIDYREDGSKLYDQEFVNDKMDGMLVEFREDGSKNLKSAGSITKKSARRSGSPRMDP